MRSLGGWLGGCLREKSLSGVGHGSHGGEGELCAVPEDAEAAELPSASLPVLPIQGDVTGCRRDAGRLGAEQGCRVANSLNLIAGSFPGTAKPLGTWHSLPRDDLLNALQDAGPNPLRSSIRCLQLLLGADRASWQRRRHRANVLMKHWHGSSCQGPACRRLGRHKSYLCAV